MCVWRPIPCTYPANPEAFENAFRTHYFYVQGTVRETRFLRIQWDRKKCTHGRLSTNASCCKAHVQGGTRENEGLTLAQPRRPRFIQLALLHTQNLYYRYGGFVLRTLHEVDDLAAQASKLWLYVSFQYQLVYVQRLYP
jgi:hypothetical protein